VGHFLQSNIFNIDEIPLCFEYLDSRTYAPKGCKTVRIRETRSGWDKRQATLLLCIFADGIPRIPPLILFAGTGRRLGTEPQAYDRRVAVNWTDSSWNNEDMFLWWINTYLIPVLGGRPSLFVMDQAECHKTPAVLDTLRHHDVIPSIVPGGCTGLVQPLDVSFNRPFKDTLKEITERKIYGVEQGLGLDRWTVGWRRITTTICVGEAWERSTLPAEKQELVRRCFRKLGL
jgi:hypothetical protein